MEKLIVLTLILASFVAHAEKLQLDRAVLTAGMKTTIVESKDTRARVFGVTVGTRLEDKLSPSLMAFLNLDANFETGSNESVGSVAEYEAIQGINLQSGGLRYNPFKALRIEAGALNQRHHKAPLLIGSTAFAAVEERVSHGIFYIQATQAIPTNNELTKRLGNVDDGTALFMMETIGIKAGELNKFEIAISHFMFSGLSSAVAGNSREMGNSVSGISDTTKFNYTFNGMNVSADMKLTTASGYKVLLGGEYLFNNDAPDGRNMGLLVKGGLEVNSLKFELETFENQSDTSPAYYNDKSYGHNNRKGNSISFAKNGEDFKYSVKYTKANVIENDSFVLEDIEILTLSMVKYYEL